MTGREEAEEEGRIKGNCVRLQTHAFNSVRLSFVYLVCFTNTSVSHLTQLYSYLTWSSSDIRYPGQQPLQSEKLPTPFEENQSNSSGRSLRYQQHLGRKTGVKTKKICFTARSGKRQHSTFTNQPNQTFYFLLLHFFN